MCGIDVGMILGSCSPSSLRVVLVDVCSYGINRIFRSLYCFRSGISGFRAIHNCVISVCSSVFSNIFSVVLYVCFVSHSICLVVVLVVSLELMSCRSSILFNSFLLYEL